MIFIRERTWGCSKGLITALSIASCDPVEKSFILWGSHFLIYDMNGNESEGGCQGLFSCKDVVPTSLMLAPAIC